MRGKSPQCNNEPGNKAYNKNLKSGMFREIFTIMFEVWNKRIIKKNIGNMLNNLESKILNKIHQKKIKPLKKWVLILRQVSVWFLVLLFLTLGGLSFSVMSVILFYGDWSIYSHLVDNLGSFFLLTFPYLWLILFLTFLCSIYKSFNLSLKPE